MALHDETVVVYVVSHMHIKKRAMGGENHKKVFLLFEQGVGGQVIQ